MNILVIDDSEAAQIAFEQVLSHEGYVVTSALTAEEGLQSIRKEAPDLIVLDVQLPDVLGTDLCEILKKDPATRYIPILMCTGHKNVVHGLNQGADDYMVKPCGKEEMLARVNALLRRVEMEKERALEKAAQKHRQERAATQQKAAAPQHQQRPADAVPPSGKIRQGFLFAWTSLAYPLKSLTRLDEFPMPSVLAPLWILCFFQTAVRLAGTHAEPWLHAASSGCAGPVFLWSATALFSAWLLPRLTFKHAWSRMARVCAAAAAPLALRGFLALLYTLICDGVPSEFSAGPLLRPSWLHASSSLVSGLAHFDFFALWWPFVVGVGARRVGKCSLSRAAFAGIGAFGLWILAQEAGRFAAFGP